MIYIWTTLYIPSQCQFLRFWRESNMNSCRVSAHLILQRTVKDNAWRCSLWRFGCELLANRIKLILFITHTALINTATKENKLLNTFIFALPKCNACCLESWLRLLLIMKLQCATNCAINRLNISNNNNNIVSYNVCHIQRYVGSATPQGDDNNEKDQNEAGIEAESGQKLVAWL